MTKRLGLHADVEMVAPEELGKYKEEMADLPTDPKELEILYQTLNMKIEENTQLLLFEEDKRKKWHAENLRRKHNYIPLIYEFLKLLAGKGKLPELIGKAKEEQKKKMIAKAEAKKAAEKKETEEKKMQ